MALLAAPPDSVTADAVVTPVLRALVVDDHRVFAELLAHALDDQTDIECVAIAVSGREGEAKAAAYRPDVVILDVRLPDTSGLEMIDGLRRVLPDVRVVVLTAHPRFDVASQALEYGAVAFLAKDEHLDDLLRAVRGATLEHPVLSRSLPPDPVEQLGLTPRETEVLKALAKGSAAAAIADELGLSAYTVRDHIKAILSKFGVRTQLEAVLRAIELDIVEARGI